MYSECSSVAQLERNRRWITSSRIRVSARRKDSIEKSKLVPDLAPGLNSIEKKWTEYFARFSRCGKKRGSIERFTFEYLQFRAETVNWKKLREGVAKVALRVRQVGKLCVFVRSDRHSDKNSAKFNYASRRIDIPRYLAPVF